MTNGKRFIALAVIVFCMLIVPMSAQASSTKEKIKKLTNQMERYEVYQLFMNITTKKKVTLSDRQKAKAAAMSLKIDFSHGLEKGNFGGYVLFSISSKKLETASKNMFGEKISASKLKKNPKKEEIDSTLDAYRLEDGTPVVYYYDGETDTDYAAHSLSVKKNSKNTYTATKKVYFGHWGANKGQSNYKITYKVKKSNKSDYGYVIVGMEIDPIKK